MCSAHINMQSGCYSVGVWSLFSNCIQFGEGRITFWTQNPKFKVEDLLVTCKLDPTWSRMVPLYIQLHLNIDVDMHMFLSWFIVPSFQWSSSTLCFQDQGVHHYWQGLCENGVTSWRLYGPFKAFKNVHSSNQSLLWEHAVVRIWACHKGELLQRIIYCPHSTSKYQRFGEHNLL